MSGTVNNHVVAKVYLSGFCCPGKPGYLYASKITKYGWSKIKRPMSTSEVCVHRDFYTIMKNGSLDRNTLEQKYNLLFESKWINVISRLKNFPFSLLREKREVFWRDEVFSDADAQIIIKFLHHQYKKSPKMRRSIVMESEKKGGAFWKKISGAFPPGINPEKSKRIFQQMIHTSLLKQSIENDSGIIEDILTQYNWLIWTNNTSTPFITSDSPVLWPDAAHRGKTKVWYLPLTSRFGLEIENNFYLEQKLRFIEAKESDVRNLNEAIKGSAFRTIIGADKKVLQDLIDR